MPERIDARPVLAVVGATLILISLFLDWFQAPASEWSMTAWEAFELLDLLLAGIALTAVYLAWEQISGRQRLGGSWLLPLGLVALVIVVSQILDPPPAAIVPAALADPVGGPEADPDTGAWLALGGAGALVVAGVLSVASVSITVEMDASRRTEATTRRHPAEDAS